MVHDFFEELKSLIKEKIKCFFSKCKYALIIISFILLVFSILLLEQKEPDTIENQQIYFLGISIENWVQWITLITIPYTAIWAVYQFKKQRDAKRQEKATQIADEFSKTLVDDLYMLEYVFTDSLLLEYIPLKESQTRLFKYFNTSEARRILKSEDCVTIYKSIRKDLSTQLDNIYHIKLFREYTNCSEKKYKLLIEKAKKGNLTSEELKEIDDVIKNITDMPYHFFQLEAQTLNKLEFICMDISCKAADSNYIYQSLHQVFLRTIRTLYMEISIINKNSTDKFYTNIINVYNTWRNKYVKELKIEERRIKKANEKINPKTKTV